MYPQNQPIFWAIDELRNRVDLRIRDDRWHESTAVELARWISDFEKRANTALTSLATAQTAVESAERDELSSLIGTATTDLLRATVSAGSNKFDTLLELDSQINDRRRAADLSEQYLHWIGSLARTSQESALQSELLSSLDRFRNLLNSHAGPCSVMGNRLLQAYQALGRVRVKQLDRFPANPAGISQEIEMLCSQASDRLDKIEERWLQNPDAIHNEFEGARYYAGYLVALSRDCMFTYERSLEEVRMRTGGAIAAALRTVVEGVVHPDLGYYAIYRDIWAASERAMQVLERARVLVNSAYSLATTEAEQNKTNQLSDKFSDIDWRCRLLLKKVHPYKERMGCLFENVGALRDDLMVREGLIKLEKRRAEGIGCSAIYRIVQS